MLVVDDRTDDDGEGDEKKHEKGRTHDEHGDPPFVPEAFLDQAQGGPSGGSDRCGPDSCGNEWANNPR